MMSAGQTIYPIGYLPLTAQIQHEPNGTHYLPATKPALLCVLDKTNIHPVAKNGPLYVAPAFFSTHI